MKKIILLRGCQGSGKTTLIRDYGLQRYAIGMDTFRELYSAAVPTLDGFGSLVVDADIERQVNDATREAVEARMRLGTTIVIDAMNLAEKRQGAWAELAGKYGYETLLIDVQGDATDKQLLARNAIRGDKMIGEAIVLRSAELGRTRPLHPAVREIRAEDLDTELSTEVRDLSGYDKIVVVGDVHSMASVLEEAIAEHGSLDDPSILWIFLGDLFDRGPDPARVFELLAPARGNVVLIEGNHEINLHRVMRGKAPKNKFGETRRTREQIVSAGHRPQEIIAFLDRVIPYLVFRQDDQLFLAAHGGVRSADVQSRIVGDRFHGADLPDYHFAYGVSDRDHTFRRATTYAHVDDQLTGEGIVQFHGHRNGGRSDEPQGFGTVPRVWNLESGVESGGHLSVAVIGSAGTISGHRYAAPAPAGLEDTQKAVAGSISEQLAAHPDIKARDLGNGITAYNFTREAFSKGRWDELSTTARGLFMRGDKIVARGYSKFFNIGERNGFTREQVLGEFTLPVKVAQKANGFLLIAASVDGKLELFSKSGPTPFADAGRVLFERLFDADRRERFRALLERTDTSVTFEAVLANDPHPILAEREEIVFLDVIDNAIEFRIRHDLARAVESVLGVAQVPSQVVKTRQELAGLVAEYETGDLEGAVLRDAEGRMTKIKAEPYRRVKKLRGPLTRVLEGKAASLPSNDEDLVAYERLLRASGVWDRLEEFAVVNPNAQRVLNLPLLLLEARQIAAPATV